MQALGGHPDIEDTGTTYRVGCPMYCFREYTWQLLQGWEVSGQRPARAPVCVCVSVQVCYAHMGARWALGGDLLRR